MPEVKCFVLFFAVEDSQWWFGNGLLQGTIFVEEIDGGFDSEHHPTTIDTSYFFWGREKEWKTDTIEIADGEGA
jgi:hypothetical protein